MTTTRILDYFTSLVAEDDSLPLTEAALSLAQDAYPDLDLQGVLAEIDELVLRVRRRMPEDADIKQKVGVLNRFFFRELGFTSNLNDYYDPDNSHLNMVLKRRRGIPISLAVVYLEMSKQLGIPVRGVSFPAHFLLRVTTPDGDVMLDPTTGHSLSESAMVEMLEPYVQRVGESIGSALRVLLQPATRREIVDVDLHARFRPERAGDDRALRVRLRLLLGQLLLGDLAEPHRRVLKSIREESLKLAVLDGAIVQDH